jgi:hypothetical protein
MRLPHTVLAFALLMCFHADARSVRAGARESIQAFGAENISVHGDIDLDVDQAWDARPSRIAAESTTPGPAGSIVYARPGPCTAGGRLGAIYYHCNGVWYEPRFAGASITYVVVNPPPQIVSSLMLNELSPQTWREH